MQRILAVTVVAVGILIGLFAGAGAAQAAPSRAQPVVEQNNPGFAPFQWAPLFPNESPGMCAKKTVPANQRLVIEYLWGGYFQFTDRVMLTTIAGGESATYTWWLDDKGWFDAQVRLYADPGTSIEVCPFGGLAFGSFVVSGHLVTLPGN
jgi:hypothetical protein